MNPACSPIYASHLTLPFVPRLSCNRRCTPTSARTHRTVSAPGKVLVTGGYLVLRSLPGLTLSTTARFRTTASWRDAPVSGAGAGAGAGAARRADARAVGVVVTSPQLWCEWRYTMEVNHPFKLASV